MSEADGRRLDPQRAAEQLCAHPDAVGALLALHAAGGSADLGQLTCAHPGTPIDMALRWLTAQRLVNPGSGAGSIDQVDPHATFTLTALGGALASSMIAILTLADQVRSDPKASDGGSRWSGHPSGHAC